MTRLTYIVGGSEVATLDEAKMLSKHLKVPFRTKYTTITKKPKMNQKYIDFIKANRLKLMAAEN